MRSEASIQPSVERNGLKAMRGGILSGVVISVCIGGLLIWTMAAHDPYWRLFEAHSLPAPDYESPAEIEAALASAPGVTRSSDSSAVRPEAPSAGEADGFGAPVAMQPRSADPLIAVPVALSADGSVTPTKLAEQSPMPRDEIVGAAPAVALAPPPLFQSVTGPPDGMVVAGRSAPSPVSAADAPAPLWVAADEASEEVMALTRAQRVDVQRRLALAGFDPQGFDGVFGPRTRQAIADFQAAWGFPSTGYLDSSMHADLRARTEEAYVALASRAATQPQAAPELAPVARERAVAANESDGCARDSDGRIIERQNLGCDLKGLAEKVVSLGRDKLAHEEGGAVAVVSDSGVAVTPGARR